MAPITLWRAPLSANVERVALALAHKDLDVESVVISYDDRSAVEAVSGQGLVPVISDDGMVLADSPRILEYLEERYPSPPLFPAAAAARAEVDVFVDWFNRVWKVAPNAIEVSTDAGEIAAHGETMRRHLEVFESLLDGRDHLLGDEFSAADCIAFPFLKYARGRDAEDDEPFHVILEEHQRTAGPRLLTWIDRVDARPRA